MKRLVIIFSCFLLIGRLDAQVMQGGEEELLEQMASGADENMPEETGNLPFAERSMLRMTGINEAGLDDLLRLPGMTARHAAAIIAYRGQFGPFIHLMELQAVPGLGIDLIRQILPYLKLGLPNGGHPGLGERLRSGKHMVLLRTAQSWEGFSQSDRAGVHELFPGRGTSLLLRYGYRYGNDLQWGLAMEKDAGERLVPSSVWKGMDFTSFYVAARHLGPIRAFVLGDYILNLGQGLIHWQGMAFGKTSNAILVNRQGESVRPYGGIDENRFHRGIAIESGGSRLGTLVFLALDRMDGNRVVDSAGREVLSVSSFQWSGLHRTPAEIANKDAIRQKFAGASIFYRNSQFKLAMNGIAYFFNPSMLVGTAPYQAFNIAGDGWWNLSADYSLVLRNVFMFGELGLSAQRGVGFVHGMLASLDSKLDLSILFRSLSPSFKSMQANAFTEQTAPSNETGLYLGLQFRPRPGLLINGSLDGWYHPWLRYRVNGPSTGRSGMIAVTWNPTKTVALNGTMRLRKNLGNAGTAGMTIAAPLFRSIYQYRFQVSFKPNRFIEIRQRADMAFSGSAGKPRGWAQSYEIIGQSRKGNYSMAARVTWFSSDAYETRLFQYERDVLNYYSISSLDRQGRRIYLVLNGSFPGEISVQGKIFCTLFNDLQSFMVNSQELLPRAKWGFRAQVIHRF